MRSEDFATARPYPEDCDSEAQPAPANVFTPISAADRLRERPRRALSRQQTRVMPPLMPGQQYGLSYEEKDLYWEDAFEEAAPPSPAAYPPQEEDLPLGVEAWQQDYFATYGGQDDYPMNTGYQQSYWDHLRESAPAQSAPAETDAFYVPAYLQDQDFGLLPISPAQNAPSAAYTAYGQGNDFYPAEAWLGEDDGFSPHAPAYQEGPGEYAPPYGDGAPYGEPFATPGTDENSSLAARARQAFVRAFTTDRGQNSPRMSFAKVAAICAITVMLAFCVIEIGKIALSMMRNEAEMKTVREAFYANSGQELALGAARVELLPPGVTFAPTATPQPPASASPAGAAASAEQNETAEPSPGLVQRTKESKYPDNPLGNIREAMEAPLANNPDTIGHLRIDGVVDEYVVQRNNTYYLTRNARGSGDPAGAVFMDESCRIKTPPENLLLRGQGAVEGKLFFPLLYYETGGAEFVRQHALIHMDTLYEEGEYVIFAVIAASSDPQSPQYFNYAGYPSFQSDWHMESYVKGARQHSLYEIPVDVVPSDRLLTISTLGNGSEKECMVIMARKLRPGETTQSLSTAMNAIREQ